MIDSATLQLYVTDITDQYSATNVWPCDNNSWSESTLTFQNAPYQGMNSTLYPDIEHVSNADQWQNWNMTAQVRDMYNAGRSAATLIVQVAHEYHDPSSYILFCSKESNLGYPPELIIHWIPSVPEFPATLIVATFMLTTLAVAVVYIRRRPKTFRNRKREGFAEDIVTCPGFIRGH